MFKLRLLLEMEAPRLFNAKGSGLCLKDKYGEVSDVSDVSLGCVKPIFGRINLMIELLVPAHPGINLWLFYALVY